MPSTFDWFLDDPNRAETALLVIGLVGGGWCLVRPFAMDLGAAGRGAVRWVGRLGHSVRDSGKIDRPTQCVHQPSATD